MAFSSATFARSKSALVCLLALLLLLTPVCGSLCSAQACEQPRAEEKSPCHDSVGSRGHEHEGSTLRSERNCGLDELPVALPADFRGLRSDSVASANVGLPTAVHASSFRAMHPVYCSDLQDRRRSNVLPDGSLLSITPL